MKHLGGALLVLAGVAVAALLAWQFLVWSFPGMGGSMRTEERPLPPFTRIEIHGLAEVTLVQGGSESASVTAPSRQLSRLNTDVSGGTLVIQGGAPRRWYWAFFGRSPRPAHVTVTLRDLHSIETSGAVKIRADRLKLDQLTLSGSGATSIRIADLDAKQLSVNGTGAMKLELAGQATKQKVELSGAANYRAADLTSEDADITVSGAGRVVVHAQKTLQIELSGAASVEYFGNPKVTQQVSGAGRIKHRDAGEHRMRVAIESSLRSAMRTAGPPQGANPAPPRGGWGST